MSTTDFIEFEADISNIKINFNEIIKIMVEKVNKQIKKVLGGLNSQLRDEIKKRIFNHPTYMSLMGDMPSPNLQAEFGFVKPASILSPLVEEWANNFVVEFDEFKSNKKNISGLLSIKVIDSSFRNVLSMKEASYVSSSKQGKALVDWLHWLLMEGTQIVIQGYHISYDLTPAQIAQSRSGFALMFPLGTGGGNSPYSVPAAYAGTKDDNFITQAMTGLDKFIFGFLSKKLFDKTTP